MDASPHAGLGLLASAVAGRSLAIADSADDVAWTDGEVIYLPHAASHHDALQAVALQASLIAAGSLAPDVLRRLARNRARSRRYLTIEGHRALAAHETLLPPTARRLIDHTIGSDSPATSFAMSAHDTDEPPRVFGELRPREVLRDLRIYELADDEGEDIRDVLASLTLGRGGPIGRLLARMLRPARGHNRGKGAHDAPTQVMWSGRVDVNDAPRVALRADDDEASDGRYGTRYPEWDAHTKQYRPDWCTVIERTATKQASAHASPVDNGFRRALSRLEVGLTPVRRRRHGDDVDIDAAIESTVNVRAGVADTDEVYVESLRRRRDLSVLVLLDVSGSAGEPGADGQSVHEHQRRLAAALTTTLHDLGDRVALYAFNSRGRDAVEMMRLVAFGKPVDATAHRRLAALAPAAYTRLGAAVRHATTILQTQAGTPRRLLVVISDGFAYDHGYEGRYGEADARRALAEARRRGVGCACISVGTDTDDDALRRVFGTAAHASIPRAEQAPIHVGPLFRSALRVADAQRRAYERRRAQ